MPNVIFLDADSRVVGRAKSPTYTAAPDPTDPRQVFIGYSFDPANMMALYDKATGTYTADAVTEAYHTPPPAVEAPSEGGGN